jgi:DNA-binding IscR family transcriptional regulator
MRNDSRLSSVLHALLHMERHEGPMTSDQLAGCMHTNPVVVRRLMAGLREVGLVSAAKGHHGGWTLGRPLTEATLFDVHVALGAPKLFGFGNHDDNPTCLLERAANAALDEARAEAEATLLARMRQVRLSDLATEYLAHVREQAQIPKD